MQLPIAIDHDEGTTYGATVETTAEIDLLHRLVVGWISPAHPSRSPKSVWVTPFLSLGLVKSNPITFRLRFYLEKTVWIKSAKLNNLSVKSIAYIMNFQTTTLKLAR